MKIFWWKMLVENLGGNTIYDILEVPVFQKYSIRLVFQSTLYLSLSVSVCCIYLFVSLCLGHCHQRMTSFQKIFGLYVLEHHTMEINGDVTMRDNEQRTIKDRATQSGITRHINPPLDNRPSQLCETQIFRL